MRTKTRMLVGLACGMCAAILLGIFVWGTSTSVARQQKALFARYGGDIVEVCVANADIEPGKEISTNMLEKRRWISALLPAKPVLASNTKYAIGKRTNSLILKNEPLTGARLSSRPKRLDLVRVGYSAVTIESDPVHALGGEVSSGMVVSLMSAQAQNKVVVIAPSVRVLSSSTAQENENDEQKTAGIMPARSSNSKDITWVTLEIPTPLVAQVIAASNANTINLVLDKAMN